jgi:8-oxo-dGTP pyrophosphatase MutT (NUDIX family)
MIEVPAGYRLTRKVLTYITRGDTILVFTQPLSPEAGIQVPAGTIEDSETPEAAALREASEETGLSNLRIDRYLGSYHFDMSEYWAEIQERHVFHLLAPEGADEAWRHYECHACDGRGPIPFDLFWHSIDPAPPLIAGQGDMLHLLLKR